MSLKNYSHDEKKQMSMVELANLLLSDQKKDIPFKELFAEVSELKEFTEEQKKANIGQFYTDLNIEGQFMNVGSNVWALRRWYPVDQVKSETKPAPKKKTKKETKKKPAKKRKPETEKAEEETTEVAEDSATKNAENNELEELTGDFSAFEGEDDLDDEESQFDLYDEELEMDANYEHDSDDEDDEDEEDDDEDDTEDAANDEEDKESADQSG